ncbi:cytosolic Fe-S cluster assembly factor NBP35 [Vairimorpha necatrix]|uniref:Cytosolic Fe-S cluster assembly factor NBP35 n=1 Tax=Vairimorpha necatrix TaxID=6039 RepID=A0AAX4JB78_9MICR
MNNSCPSTNLGKSEQCRGCPNQSLCGSIKPDDFIHSISENMSHLKLVLAIMSGKGGVGKSTITRNITEILSKKKMSPLLIDLDLSGPSIPKMTSTEGEVILETNQTIYPIKISDNLGCISMGYFDNVEVYTSSLKTNIIRNIFSTSHIKDYDVVIIDTPPNITDEHLAIVNYLKVDFCIIVTTPQMLSFQDVKRQFSFCRKNNIKILGVIENMKGFQCEKCECREDVFYDSGIEEQCKEKGIRYLGSIPLKKEYGKKGDQGEIIGDPIFEDIGNLIEELYLSKT